MAFQIHNTNLFSIFITLCSKYIIHLSEEFENLFEYVIPKNMDLETYSLLHDFIRLDYYMYTGVKDAHPILYIEDENRNRFKLTEGDVIIFTDNGVVVAVNPE